MTHYSKVDRSRFLRALSRVLGQNLERYEDYRTICLDGDGRVYYVPGGSGANTSLSVSQEEALRSHDAPGRIVFAHKKDDRVDVYAGPLKAFLDGLPSRLVSREPSP